MWDTGADRRRGQVTYRRCEGHKDYVISDRWAVKLYEHFLVPVVVSAGIHYDEITPDGIKTVIEEMEKLLEEVMAYE